MQKKPEIGKKVTNHKYFKDTTWSTIFVMDNASQTISDLEAFSNEASKTTEMITDIAY